MRVHAVINRKAGGALGFSVEQLAREAEATFRAAGHEIAIDVVEPEDIEAALDKAVAAAPDILVAGGGDGTIRSAASRLLGSGIALGIIPLGTVNRLAHDLRIPAEPRAASQALAERRVSRDRCCGSQRRDIPLQLHAGAAIRSQRGEAESQGTAFVAPHKGLFQAAEEYPGRLAGISNSRSMTMKERGASAFSRLPSRTMSIGASRR